jgi:hypothetical protein
MDPLAMSVVLESEEELESERRIRLSGANEWEKKTEYSDNKSERPKMC